ncbi:MAG: hypothetical protein U0270_29815 [Labilithrix sp.]
MCKLAASDAPPSPFMSALHDVKQAASRHTNEPQGTGCDADP